MKREEYYDHIFNKMVDGVENEEIYDVFFQQIVPKLKDRSGLKVLFGNQDGSRSRGMSNQSSDIDMHVFGETDNSFITYELMYEEGYVQEKKIVFDIASHCLEVTLESVKDYSNTVRKYPTVFYRTEQERDKYSPDRIHWNVRYRDDGEIFEFIQFLIADTIFVSDNEKVNINELYLMVKTIDMLDLQYVRAYGNYHNVMEGKEEVLVRKYLYTLYEIFFCEWLINYGTRPPMIFEDLMKGQMLPNEVRKSIKRIIEINQSSTEHKIKLVCKVDLTLNNYISNELNVLKQKIASYNVNERYLSIIERTPIERKQQIIYF